jgi:hypothetical protein
VVEQVERAEGDFRVGALDEGQEASHQVAKVVDEEREVRLRGNLPNGQTI